MRLLATALIMLSVATAPVAAQQRVRARRFEVTEATIAQLQAAMRDGRLTAVELVDAYLARIAKYDAAGPSLNAMLRLNPKAHAEAIALDAERRAGHVRGPWHGIPVVFKDNYSTNDMPTSGGSLALASLQPINDAFVVARLRAAGAIILGKTNLHELAAGITSISSLGGQTRNPYDLSRCPGGSSGGTGAAVSANLAAIGWGTDTCGSIRYPSAFNSLFGLRPTQGLASRSGIIPLSHTQDTPGPLARTVTDLALGLDLTVGPDATDPDTRALTGRLLPTFSDSLDKNALQGMRLGVLANYFADSDPEVADTVRAALRAMRDAGAMLVEVNIGGLDTLLSGGSASNFEFAADLRAFLAAIPNAPVHSLHEIITTGQYADVQATRYRLADTLETGHDKQHDAAMARRVVIQQRVAFVLDSLHLDALAYPTLRQRPVLIGDPQTGGNCVLAALTGFPALSAPAGFLNDGLPVGIELLGRAFSDARLVAMAYAYEQAGPRRRPPSSAPPLFTVAMKPMHAIRVTTHAATARAAARFTFDAPSSQLSWTVHVTGVAGSDVTALLLRRIDAAGPGPVIQRISGPGASATRGVVKLRGADLDALNDGRLALSLVTTRATSALDEGRLRPHAAAGRTEQ